MPSSSGSGAGKGFEHTRHVTRAELEAHAGMQWAERNPLSLGQAVSIARFHAVEKGTGKGEGFVTREEFNAHMDYHADSNAHVLVEELQNAFDDTSKAYCQMLEDRGRRAGMIMRTMGRSRMRRRMSHTLENVQTG